VVFIINFYFRIGLFLQKGLQKLFNQKDDVISSDLEAAKIFHAKGAYLNKSTYAELMVQGSKSVLSTEKIAKKVFFIKLSPLWKDAFEVKAYDGSDLIVVPTPENRLSDKTFEIRRFFIFTKKGGSVVDGKIVEFLGLNYPLKDKIDGIIANYKNSSVLDLTGAIFEYDLNYFRLSTEVIKQGKRTGLTASFHYLPIAQTNVSGKVAMGYYDTGAPDANGCSTLSYCEGYYSNGEAGVNCNNLGYSTSNCNPSNPNPTGTSDSGYDSSGAYQSGGGPYAGNTAPPNTSSGIGIEVVVAPDTRPCLGTMVTQISAVANVVSSLQNIFDNQTNTAGVSDMIVRLANSNDWNVKIGEKTIPDAVDPYTNQTTQINAETIGVHGSVEINFNKNYLNASTDLGVARTMIHELIHSYFEYGLTKTSDPGYTEFVGANELLFKKGTAINGDGQNNAQHQQIAAKYVDQMASLLEIYANNRGITSPNQNLSLSQYCKDLAWGGLSDTKAYRKYAPNKTRIETTIKNEATNATNSTKKKGC